MSSVVSVPTPARRTPADQGEEEAVPDEEVEVGDEEAMRKRHLYVQCLHRRRQRGCLSVPCGLP